MGARALSGLTTRGRSFLVAGLVSTVGAILFDYQVLLRIGLFLVLMPLVSVLLVSRTRYRVACRRALEPPRATVGDEARVHLRLENVSRLPSGTLLVEDRVPYVLGSRPRFVLGRVESGGYRQVMYRVRSDVRGRFVLGPLSLRLADPFGLCELSRSFTTHHALTITPRVQQLAEIGLGRAWVGRGDGHSAAAATVGEDDVGIREYRHGDDMRRVHWRSTARLGELVVRREEQVWQSTASILLDTRALAHRGDGPASSFEWAVSAVASVGMHLVRRGYAVRLLTDTGVAMRAVRHDTPQVDTDTAGLLLDTLAMATPSRVVSLGTAMDALRDGNDSLLVAVVGELTDEEVARLARCRLPSTTRLAFVIDTGAWHTGSVASGEASRDDRERFAGNLSVLRSAGWRAVPVTAGARFPELWLQARKHEPNDTLGSRG